MQLHFSNTSHTYTRTERGEEKEEVERDALISLFCDPVACIDALYPMSSFYKTGVGRAITTIKTQNGWKPTHEKTNHMKI